VGRLISIQGCKSNRPTPFSRRIMAKMTKRAEDFYERWKKKVQRLKNARRNGEEQPGGLPATEAIWVAQLPPYLRPDQAKCEELERVRRRYHLPHDMFLMILTSSPATTRRLQEHFYTEASERMPEASEKERLEAVFRSRVFPQNPAGLKMTEDEVQKEMEHIECLEDLIKRITEIEKQEPRFLRDMLGIGKRAAKRVDEILRS